MMAGQDEHPVPADPDSELRLLRRHVQMIQTELERRAEAVTALVEAQAALEGARQLLAEQDLEIKRLTAGHDSAWARVVQRTEDLRQARGRIADLETRLQEVLRGLPDRVADLEAERHRLLNSLSWRITRPLRAGRRLLGQIRRLLGR